MRVKVDPKIIGVMEETFQAEVPEDVKCKGLRYGDSRGFQFRRFYYSINIALSEFNKKSVEFFRSHDLKPAFALAFLHKLQDKPVDTQLVRYLEKTVPSFAGLYAPVRQKPPADRIFLAIRAEYTIKHELSHLMHDLLCPKYFDLVSGMAVKEIIDFVNSSPVERESLISNYDDYSDLTWPNVPQIFVFLEGVAQFIKYNELGAPRQAYSAGGVSPHRLGRMFVFEVQRISGVENPIPQMIHCIPSPAEIENPTLYVERVFS